MKKQWDGFLKIPEGRACSIRDGETTTVAVKHFTFPAGHKFYLSTMRGALIGGQKMTPIAFDRETTWHQLTEDDGVWMTDLPVEQAQADNLMRGIEGDVLVGGLGLGYAAQRLARKPGVRRVVVVEINEAVVELVQRHVRHRGNVSVVRGDVLEFMEETRRQFDYAYLDTWAPDGERVLFQEVIPMRRAAARCGARRIGSGSQSTIRCWNEDVMRGQLVMSLVGGITATALDGPHKIPLEFLASEIGNMWHDWKVPFFRFALEAGAKTNLVEEARFYANVYGMPGWEETWKEFAQLRLCS